MIRGLPFVVGGRRRWLSLLLTIISLFVLAQVLFRTTNIRSQLDKVPLPGRLGLPADETLEQAGFSDLQYHPHDRHPISLLIAEADKRWREYEDSRSRTFRETVSEYRRKYGRHPPPGFDDWYKFARERNVHNIDDFEQIMDDLRPFWAVRPSILRRLAAHMWEKEDDGVSLISIRNHKIVKLGFPSWRLEISADLIGRLTKYLPDMDIPMNRLDQPRVAVPWDDMQAMLSKELETRSMPPDALNEFTTNMTDLLEWKLSPEEDKSPREDPAWYGASGTQYMDIAKTACPPESHAVAGTGLTDSEAIWKDRAGGIVKNFNLSSDLCTIGPEIQDKHGFLYSSSLTIATKRLVPIFGECKVNINNDILFPANMYWKHDVRYDYDETYDVNWNDKNETVIWRGVTSGGTQLADNWERMHRQRLVQLLNSTIMGEKEVRVLTEQPDAPGEFENFRQFKPGRLLEQHTDVGFTEAWGCIPDECPFYDGVWTFKDLIDLSKQFKYKYLVDVDGHSFSGRWRAFLMSKSLGIKATIFREWHDSRLFAWRHFVPLDNRYDDIFSLLTYFMGTGDAENRSPGEAYVARHDMEAKRIALQGREWAKKVLRREDIEVYMLRLLLEYARIIDENRDHIGYSGDGGELDKFDASKGIRP